ncbi:MAG: hypothetical protein LBD99_01940 [Candidatus Margulisbacteria bacterium]|jgi:hypothetical protein|nr:hypothetical protein [Candidatus Margulisiibacteriota bacterium]
MFCCKIIELKEQVAKTIKLAPDKIKTIERDYYGRVYKVSLLVPQEIFIDEERFLITDMYLNYGFCFGTPYVSRLKDVNGKIHSVW